MGVGANLDRGKQKKLLYNISLKEVKDMVFLTNESGRAIHVDDFSRDYCIEIHELVSVLFFFKRKRKEIKYTIYHNGHTDEYIYLNRAATLGHYDVNNYKRAIAILDKIPRRLSMPFGNLRSVVFQVRLKDGYKVKRPEIFYMEFTIGRGNAKMINGIVVKNDQEFYNIFLTLCHSSESYSRLLYLINGREQQRSFLNYTLYRGKTAYIE